MAWHRSRVRHTHVEGKRLANAIVPHVFKESFRIDITINTSVIHYLLFTARFRSKRQCVLNVAISVSPQQRLGTQRSTAIVRTGTCSTYRRIPDVRWRARQKWGVRSGRALQAVLPL